MYLSLQISIFCNIFSISVYDISCFCEVYYVQMR